MSQQLYVLLVDKLSRYKLRESRKPSGKAKHAQILARGASQQREVTSEYSSESMPIKWTQKYFSKCTVVTYTVIS